MASTLLLFFFKSRMDVGMIMNCYIFFKNKAAFNKLDIIGKM